MPTQDLTTLEMYRGDTPVWELTVTDKQTGAAEDITGYTIWMTAKRAKTDTDAQAVFQISTTSGDITITDAVNGLAEVVPPSSATLSLTESVKLYFDVQVKPPASSRIHTITDGVLVVALDVTQTVTP